MQNFPWWMTTVLGLAAAVAGPLAANCLFGAAVCSIITAVNSGIVLLLGITHPGTGLIPPKVGA